MHKGQDMDGNIQYARMTWTVEMSAHVLSKVSLSYGCKVALHVSHQNVASLAHTLFVACLASDIVFKIRAFASNIWLAAVSDASATAGNVATSI